MTDDDLHDGAPARARGPEPAKRKLKRLVFAALASPGAVGVAAMALSAQAHGNASSHLTRGQLDWDFDNFVVRREALANPGAPTTIQLQDLAKRQDELRTTLATSRSIPAIVSAPMHARVLRLEQSRRLAEDAVFLDTRVQQLKNSLALRPTTRAVLDHLAQGRGSEAIATIEGVSKDAKTVLTEYSLVQLDLLNYGAVDNAGTPAVLPAVITVSQAALAFQSARMTNAKAEAATLLHNLASAAAPDVGSVTPDQHKVGRDAAARALGLREALGNAHDIAVAQYMVGVYQYRDRQFTQAEQTFASARSKLSSAAPALESYAWATLFQGYAQLAAGRPEGQALVNEARDAFSKAGSPYGQQYITAGLGRL